MKKEEYISRYGEEWYIKYLEKCKHYRIVHRKRINSKSKEWRDNNNKQRHYRATKICRKNNLAWNLNRICTDLSLVENYEKTVADKFKGWILHHRLELHNDCSLRYSKAALVKIGLYYHRPANELIFVPVKEHVNMHWQARKIWDKEHKGIPYGK